MPKKSVCQVAPSEEANHYLFFIQINFIFFETYLSCSNTVPSCSTASCFLILCLMMPKLHKPPIRAMMSCDVTHCSNTVPGGLLTSAEALRCRSISGRKGLVVNRGDIAGRRHRRVKYTNKNYLNKDFIKEGHLGTAVSEQFLLYS